MKSMIGLLAALLLFALPMLAVADPNGNNNGLEHRVTVLEDGNFQVYDDNGFGKQVGELLGMAHPPWVPNVAFVVLDIEGMNALVRVNWHAIWYDETLYFDNESCSGQAYMPEFRLHDSWFTPPVLITIIEGNPHSRVPHRVVGEPQPVDIIRHVNDQGECVEPPHVPPVGWVPVMAIMRGDAPIDLHVDYPPPYKLDN